MPLTQKLIAVLATLLITATTALAADTPANLFFKIKKNGIVYYEGTTQGLRKQTIVKEWYEPIPYTSELVLYHNATTQGAVGIRNRSAEREGYKLSITGIEQMDNRLYVSIILEVREITNWIKLPTGKQSGTVFQPEVSTIKYESALMALSPNTLVNSNKTYAVSGEPIPHESLTDEKDQTLEEIEHGFAVELTRKLPSGEAIR